MDKAPGAFRTISEVADEIDVPQHVLRFWESRFTQIRPMKRGGGCLSSWKASKGMAGGCGSSWARTR